MWKDLTTFEMTEGNVPSSQPGHFKISIALSELTHFLKTQIDMYGLPSTMSCLSCGLSPAAHSLAR